MLTLEIVSIESIKEPKKEVKKSDIHHFREFLTAYKQDADLIHGTISEKLLSINFTDAKTRANQALLISLNNVHCVDLKVALAYSKNEIQRLRRDINNFIISKQTLPIYGIKIFDIQGIGKSFKIQAKYIKDNCFQLDFIGPESTNNFMKNPPFYLSFNANEEGCYSRFNEAIKTICNVINELEAWLQDWEENEQVKMEENNPIPSDRFRVIIQNLLGLK
jgi:hypothetical protein